MKKLFEPFAGFILSLISWEAWTNFLVSLTIAFLGGALAYLGKWICARGIQRLSRKKNVFVSKTRQRQNSRIEHDDDVIF